MVILSDGIKEYRFYGSIKHLKERKERGFRVYLYFNGRCGEIMKLDGLFIVKEVKDA